MNETVISIRIDKGAKEQMSRYNSINWSALLRKALLDHLARLERENQQKMETAAKKMENIRKKGTFNGGKSGAEIIREWRDKRH